jgi:hypothetical protein
MIQLLNTLIIRARDYDELSDDAIFTVIEHWALEVQDPASLTLAFDAAQTNFRNYGNAYQRWLDLFSVLLQHGGDGVPAFARNLLLAFLFHLEEPAGELWQQYDRLYHEVSMRSEEPFPRSWGDWFFPMQTFMGFVESALIEVDPVWANLLISDNVRELLDIMPTLALGGDVDIIDLDSIFVSDAQVDQVASLSEYLTACAERIGHIDPRGYPGGSDPSVPLTDVYIPLRLIPLATDDQPNHLIRYRKAAYDHPELRHYHGPSRYKAPDTDGDLSIYDVLDRHRLALIVGENGSGKTMLVRHLALENARALLTEKSCGLEMITRSDGASRVQLVRPLPIYIDLAAYLDTRRPGETLAEYTLRTIAELVQDGDISPLIGQLLDGGQCLILLDGLDQVATDDQRRLLNAGIVDAAARWRASGNRIVVTSRFSDNTALLLAREFEGFVIGPLTRSQLRPFLLRWGLTLARLRRPLLTDDDALQQAQSETLALMRVLTSNPRLASVAGTPLFLRLLAGVHREGMVLTPQPAALFQTISDSLIREWHLPQSADTVPAVLEHDVTSLLGELAYWLQSSRASGVLDEQELRRLLSQSWQNLHPNASSDEVGQAISQFISRLRSRDGLLREIQPGKYCFTFHALQEYFAARYLVSRYRFAARRIRSLLHNPRWSAVIRLAIGFVFLNSREDASDLIEAAILAQGERAEQLGFTPSALEDLLHRDLFFTVSLLGEGIEMRSSTLDSVVGRLTALWLEGNHDSPGRFKLVYDQAWRYLVSLEGTQASLVAFQIASRHLTSHDEHIQAHAIDTLTAWPLLRARGIELIVEQTSEEAPTLACMATAQALGQGENLSLDAYILLLGLTRQGGKEVEELARKALQGAAPVPEEALKMWIEMIRRRKEDPDNCLLALRVLAHMGSLPPTLIDILLKLINDDDIEFRLAAAATLASVLDLSDDALREIALRARRDAIEFRVAAIKVFQRAVQLPDEIIDLLTTWANSKEVVEVRYQAVLALGACLNASNTVLDSLVGCLDDPVDMVKAEAIDPLAHKGRNNPRIIHRLSHMAPEPSSTVRIALASALRHFPRPDDETQRTLVTLLSDGDKAVRLATLDTIARLQGADDEIVDYLISLIKESDDTAIRERSVMTLAALRHLPNRALSALASTIPVYWETCGTSIRDCLAAHAPLGQEIARQLQALIQMKPDKPLDVYHSPGGLAALVLEILGYTLGEKSALSGELLKIARDAPPAQSKDEKKRVQAIQVGALRGLAQAKEVGPGLKEALVDLLGSGPLAVRSAAGITLAHLIRNLPNPPFDGQEILDIARQVGLLFDHKDFKSYASWEKDSKMENDLLLALSWLVAFARVDLPRLPAGRII